jgi:hypothetical protein
VIKTPNDLDSINSKSEFLAYKGTGEENVLFIGSCRLSPIMYYLSLLRPDLNIFCIYVPFWSTQWNSDPLFPFPKESIKNILPKTKTMVTESVKNNSILNTCRECDKNFFDEFGTSPEEIRLPNYVLFMYLHDIIRLELKKFDFSGSEDEIGQIKEIHANSRLRLERSIEKNDFQPVNDFFNENFQNIKMFSTINHPTTIISMMTFKIMAERLGIYKRLVDFNFLRQASTEHFLSGNSTPITKFDAQHYGFRFNATIFEDEVVRKENMTYRPTEEENFITDDQIKLMMSYC